MDDEVGGDGETDRDNEAGGGDDDDRDDEAGGDGEDKKMDDKERMRDLAPVSLSGRGGTWYNFRPCTLRCSHLYPPQRTQLKCSPLMPTAMCSN